MISDVIAFIDLLSKISRKWKKFKIISAFFKGDGTRISGDTRINVELHHSEDETWFYSVKDLEDYVFVRMPVNMGAVIERVGTISGEKSADAKYFRYVGVPDGRIYGGTPSNVKVDFIVVGYKPKDILDISEGTL